MVLLSNKALTLFHESYLLEDDNDQGPQFHPLIVTHVTNHIIDYKEDIGECFVRLGHGVSFDLGCSCNSSKLVGSSNFLCPNCDCEPKVRVVTNVGQFLNCHLIFNPIFSLIFIVRNNWHNYMWQLDWKLIFVFTWMRTSSNFISFFSIFFKKNYTCYLKKSPFSY